MNEQKANTIEEMRAELEELRHQLFEATETIEAIRTGQVDALVVENDNGHQLYTLKTADHAYRVFIEKMAEGAISLNRDGIIVYCNFQLASLINLPLTNVIGVRFKNFVVPECYEKYDNLFQTCWTKDCKGEVFLKTEEDPMPVQLSLTAIEMEENMTVSIIVTDLSAQKKTQQQLEENNEELAKMNYALEVSNNDLQQFASVASHDLQEPLRKIQMFSNLLKEKGSDSIGYDNRKYIDKIINSAGRMKALIVDVLNYSKLSAKNNQFEQVDLNDVLTELLEDFELILQEKKATVSVGTLGCITANRGQIRQVFQNLISNALKFSKKDSTPVIQITAQRICEKNFDSNQHENGPFCLIHIKDNGIGFDEKYLPNIFTLFERLHSKDKYEGTGIGLTITKKIVEKHNGLVSAKSKLGEGAEFLLLLPTDQEQ